jgi:hypothetical protein
VRAPVSIPLVRTSETKDAGRCWWLWWQHWVLGWSPRRPPTWSIFGSAVHKAQEVRYKPGRKRGSVDEACAAFLAHLNGEIRKVGVDVFELEYEKQEQKAEEANKKVKLVPAHELGPIMIEEYVKYYGNDDEWEVLHTEQPFQIDVPYPRSWGPRFAGKTMVVFCGTWDSFMRNLGTGQYWLWDWKTCKKMPNVEFLEMDDQRGRYLWVAKEVLVHKGILTRKDVISGIYFQYMKKDLPDPRPRNSAGEALNKDGGVSLRQPTPRFLRVPSYRSPEQIVEQARRLQAQSVVMQLMRDGEIEPYKTITDRCPQCILWDMCTAHEAGDDWEQLRDQLYVVRDPYADHRSAMAESGIEL